MVATSNTGLASARMGLSGAGIAHAASPVTCFRTRGMAVLPWVKLPVIETASESSLPSNEPPISGTVILTVEPWTVMALTGTPWPLWSML